MFPSETEKRQKEEAQMGGLTCWSPGERVGVGEGQVITVHSELNISVKYSHIIIII